MRKNFHILIAGGGTAGHVKPGMAIADALITRGAKISWVGTCGEMESKLLSGRYIFYAIDAKSFRSKGLLGKCLAILALVKSFLFACCIVLKAKPNAVLLMGGYVSVPVGLAARLCKIPIALHEQNSRPGMANQLMARFARQIYVAYPNVFKQFSHALFLGNPTTIKPIKGHQVSVRLKKLLVIGGSLGAQSINQCVIRSLPLLPHYIIKHQLGIKHFHAVSKVAKYPNYSAAHFIDDMQHAYNEADIIICRAGAMTVSELQQIGKPAILIPYPYAVDNHQLHNTKHLCSMRYIVLEEHLLTTYRLVCVIDRLSHQGSKPVFCENLKVQLKIADHIIQGMT